MASVSKRRWVSPNGEKKEGWQVRYFDPSTGKRPGRTFTLKKDADAFAKKVEREIEDGVHVSRNESRTINEAVVALLASIDAKVAIGAMRPCTGINYHVAFKRSIKPELGGRLVIDIKPEDLEIWYHKIVGSGKMKPDTAARRLWFVGALYEFCIARGWAKTNPAIMARKSIGTPKKPDVEVFSVDDVRKIIHAANDKRWRGQPRSRDMLRLAVNLAAFCGFRWGEIFGLTINNIDLEGSTVQIRHSLDGLRNLQSPKTRAGERTVVLPLHIRDLLAAFLRDYPITNKDGIVFACDSGVPMHRSNFRQSAWWPLQVRAGVKGRDGKPIRFHSLRHFAISWMIENGWPIPDVSATVGHADVAMTLNVYAHVMKNRRQTTEAVQSLAEKLLIQEPDDARFRPLGAALLTHGAISD